MKLLIDDANLSKIKETYSYYPVDGVTTNPTILSKQESDPVEILEEIRKIIGPDGQLHIQVLSKEVDDIVIEAKKIVEKFGPNTYVKIPSVKNGFKAMKILAKEGILITATAIYTPMQAFLAAKSGAKYVAPYVNRIDNLGYDGIGLTLEIMEMLKVNEFDTEVLAASFKNNNQVLKLINKGVGSVTCPTDIIEKFVNDKNVENAIETFSKDFENKIKSDKSFIELL